MMEKVYAQIAEFAEQYGAKKVVLFGSRARGDNQPKSDIDIAIYDCSRFDELVDKLNEELWSLLTLDIVNMNALYVSDELVKEINRDGVIIYEKV